MIVFPEDYAVGLSLDLSLARQAKVVELTIKSHSVLGSGTANSISAKTILPGN